MKICKGCVDRGFGVEVHGPIVTDGVCELCGHTGCLYTYDNDDSLTPEAAALMTFSSIGRKLAEQEKREEERKAREQKEFERQKAVVYMEIRAAVREGLFAISINMPFKGDGHPIVVKLLEHFKQWNAEYTKYETCNQWRLTVRWGDGNGLGEGRVSNGIPAPTNGHHDFGD